MLIKIIKYSFVSTPPTLSTNILETIFPELSLVKALSLPEWLTQLKVWLFLTLTIDIRRIDLQDRSMVVMRGYLRGWRGEADGVGVHPVFYSRFLFVTEFY